MTRYPSILKLSCTILLFAIRATLFAQQAGNSVGMQSASPSAAQQTIPGQPGSNLPSNQPAAPSYIDQAFVRSTLQDDESQIELSQLAQQKSASIDVKQFGQQMVKIHTELDAQLGPLAKQFGIKDPQKPSKKVKHEMTKLQSLTGTDFDAAYLQAMAKDQQHSLKDFNDEQKAAQSASLQKAVKEDEVTLRQNFDVLQKLAASHNVTISEK